MPRIVSSAPARLNLGRVQSAHSTTDAWPAALDVCRKLRRRAYNPLLCFELHATDWIVHAEAAAAAGMWMWCNATNMKSV